MKKLMILAAAAGCAIAAPAAAAPVIWNTGTGANGHAYEFFAPGVNWDAAFAAAQAMTFNGQQGYLVTITSAEENNFLVANVTTSTSWTSGSDVEIEGTWKWLAGPELGTVFWKDGVTQTFANWNPGEPNNVNNEDYLHFNFNQIAGWNDVPGTLTYGYVVEFNPAIAGGAPEPATWALFILGFGAIGGVLRRSRKVRTNLTYA